MGANRVCAFLQFAWRQSALKETDVLQVALEVRLGRKVLGGESHADHVLFNWFFGPQLSTTADFSVDIESHSLVGVHRYRNIVPPAVVDQFLAFDRADPANIKRQASTANKERLAIGNPLFFVGCFAKDGAVGTRADSSRDAVRSICHVERIAVFGLSKRGTVEGKLAQCAIGVFVGRVPLDISYHRISHSTQLHIVSWQHRDLQFHFAFAWTDIHQPCECRRVAFGQRLVGGQQSGRFLDFRFADRVINDRVGPMRIDSTQGGPFVW